MSIRALNTAKGEQDISLIVERPVLMNIILRLPACKNIISQPNIIIHGCPLTLKPTTNREECRVNRTPSDQNPKIQSNPGMQIKQD
jgi:hypothetical protein